MEPFTRQNIFTQEPGGICHPLLKFQTAKSKVQYIHHMVIVRVKPAATQTSQAMQRRPAIAQLIWIHWLL